VTRFVVYALPLLMLLLATFGFVVDLLELEPHAGSVIRLAFFEQPRVPAPVVLGAWSMEACGLLALFLLAQGRCGSWWLDGLVAGWVGWVFRGPLLVVTLVVAARQPQDPWWQIAFGWWILYSICGLALGLLFHRTRLRVVDPDRLETEAPVEVSEPVDSAAESEDDGADAGEPEDDGADAGESEDDGTDAGESEDDGTDAGESEDDGTDADEAGDDEADDDEADEGHDGDSDPEPSQEPSDDVDEPERPGGGS
jgi:hypothetical protein